MRTVKIPVHLRNIVLAHELIELDVLRVLPPLLPVRTIQIITIHQVLGNGNIANAGIEPDVEDLLCILLVTQAFKILGNGNTPLEISGDTTGEETLIDP
jgi:UDP-N-acetylglucosamine enolpyruvyl transferase